MRTSLIAICCFITLGLDSPIPDPQDVVNYIFNCVNSNCNQINHQALINGLTGTDVGGPELPEGNALTKISNSLTLPVQGAHNTPLKSVPLFNPYIFRIKKAFSKIKVEILT